VQNVERLRVFGGESTVLSVLGLHPDDAELQALGGRLLGKENCVVFGKVEGICAISAG